MPPSTDWPFGSHLDLPERPREWAHCRDCGARIGWSEASCPSCGERQRTIDSDRDPKTAALLSVVLPGAGSIYTGATKRGLFQLSVFLALVALAISRGSYLELRVESGWQAAFHVSQWLILVAISAYEAANRARRVNHGLAASNADPAACQDCEWPNPVVASFCRACGEDLPDAGPTETSYRVEVREGACFCEACTRQVSPSDRRCPNCGYELRVEEPVRA